MGDYLTLKTTNMKNLVDAYITSLRANSSLKFCERFFITKAQYQEPAAYFLRNET